MLGLRYIKALPNVYVIQYKNGIIKREGLGLNFLYFTPYNSLVLIPLGSSNIPFIFQETTKDFQDVTIQGSVTYRIKEPQLLAMMMNYTLDPRTKQYISDEPKKLDERILQQIHVATRTEIASSDLFTILTSTNLMKAIHSRLKINEEIGTLGLEILALSILAIKPKPETAKALESEVRESILRRADDAAYRRRNAALEQERAIKENELQTDRTLEKIKQQIKEESLEAQGILKQREQKIAEQVLEGKIVSERKRKVLVEQTSENSKIESDANAYAIHSSFKAISTIDPKILEALAVCKMDAGHLLAMSFKILAENAQKIGQLTLTPDLLTEFMKKEK